MGKWSDWKESFLDYGRNVRDGYLIFLTPVLMLVVFNACVSMHAHDMEKEGVLWMHFAQEPENERTATFPRTEDERLHERARKERGKPAEIAAAALSAGEDN